MSSWSASSWMKTLLPKLKILCRNTGLAGTRLIFKQVGMHQEDINAIKTALAKDILADNQKEAEKKEQILQSLQANARSAEKKAGKKRKRHI